MRVTRLRRLRRQSGRQFSRQNWQYSPPINLSCEQRTTGQTHLPELLCLALALNNLRMAEPEMPGNSGDDSEDAFSLEGVFPLAGSQKVFRHVADVDPIEGGKLARGDCCFFLGVPTFVGTYLARCHRRKPG